MDINLHLGAHRTASTTLQQFLERNTATLLQSGVDVWTPSRTRKGLFAGLCERPEDVTDEVERRGNRSCGLICIELERASRESRKSVLISDENMIGSTRNNLRQQQLYPLLIERLVRFRPAFNGKIRRIGMAIRSYDTFWASCIAFGLTQNFRMPLLADLDRFVTQRRRWRDVIRDVATTFPEAEILIWPFERFASQPKAQVSFLTGELNLDLPMVGACDWHNRSPRSDRLMSILTQRKEHMTGRALTDLTGRWMPFDEAQRMALRAQYSVDLDWLRRGADGLARLMEKPGSVASSGKIITKDYDMIDIGGAGSAQSTRFLPPAGGHRFGGQDIMV